MADLDVERPVVDVLDLGAPVPRRHTPLRVPSRLLPALVVLVLAVAVALTWVHKPRPRNLTLTDLRGVYGAMVRSDGGHGMSVITRDLVQAGSLAVRPAHCRPLFDILANHVPGHALDGVGTYWIAAPVTRSLVTYRYPDATLAAQDLARISSVLAGCEAQPIAVQTDSSASTVATVTSLPVRRPDDRAQQLGYSYGDGAGRWAILVLRQTNTVTWEFSYDASGGSAGSPDAALLDGLSTLLRTAEDTRADG